MHQRKNVGLYVESNKSSLNLLPVKVWYKRKLSPATIWVRTNPQFFLFKFIPGLNWGSNTTHISLILIIFLICLVNLPVRHLGHETHRNLKPALLVHANFNICMLRLLYFQLVITLTCFLIIIFVYFVVSAISFKKKTCGWHE